MTSEEVIMVIINGVRSGMPIPAMYVHFGIVCEHDGEEEFIRAYEAVGFPTTKELH